MGLFAPVMPVRNGRRVIRAASGRASRFRLARRVMNDWRRSSIPALFGIRSSVRPFRPFVRFVRSFGHSFGVPSSAGLRGVELRARVPLPGENAS